MSSTCSSWRRRSPASASASSGSKPAMVMLVRNMSLAYSRFSTTAVQARAGAREAVAPVRVQVGGHHRRILLEYVEHAVAVMRVDVHVTDALQALALQELDRHAAVVEHAEVGRALARRVVQSRDRHEGPATLPPHDRLHGAQRGADHAGRRPVHAAERRGVAGVEKALTALRALAHELEVGGAVERAQLLVRG